MLKLEIRKQALKSRLEISEAEYELLNKGLLNQFVKLDFKEVKTIHLFLPIVEKKEPNTFFIN